MKIYTNGLARIDWESAVLRLLLERSTSTYVFDPDHEALTAFTGGGGVEISVASYERKTLANALQTHDTANNRIIYTSDDVDFGDLESGQQVKGGLLYAQVGGNDATPATDIPIAYDNGFTRVVLAADASATDTLIWVDPLDSNLPVGAELNFGGGAEAEVATAAEIGDRSISVTALGDSASAGAVSANVRTTRLVEGFDVIAILQNGNFTWKVSADGWINKIARNAA